MEVMVFQSPKKHRIIAVKKLLSENSIPTTNIKLHIYVEWSHGGRRSGPRITETVEKSDELNVPIEDFNEKLNDSQTLELYVDEKYEDLAIRLIENVNIETFFDDCIFKSNNYDEVFEKYLLLRKNNIPCEDDIIPNDDEYLLFIDPEYKEEAINVIEPKKENKEYIYEYEQINKKDNSFVQEYKERNIFKYFIPLIIILVILFIKIGNEYIIEIIINEVKYFIEIYFNNNKK
jgi:hypothetical protein